MIATYSETNGYRFSIFKLGSLLATVIIMSSCSSLPDKEASTEIGSPDTAVVLPVKKAVDPTTSQAYKKAMALLDQKRIQEAEKLLSEIAASNADIAAPFYNLGLIAENRGDTDGARAHYQRALDADSRYYLALNNLGVLSRATGDFEAALEYYTQGIKANPNSVELQYNLGVLNELYLHDSDAAVHHYERYLALVEHQDTSVKNWVEDLKRRAQ